MTDNTKLIAEARIRILSALTDPSEAECERLAKFLGDVADALEAAEERNREAIDLLATYQRANVNLANSRAALAAVIEQAKAALAYGSGDRDYLERIYATQNILASADTGAVLREVRAKAIEALVPAFDGTFYTARPLDVPFREPLKGHPTWNGHFLQDHVRTMLQRWLSAVAAAIREGRV